EGNENEEIVSDQFLITSAQVADYLKIADTPALQPHILYAQSVVAGELDTESLIARAVSASLISDGGIVVLRDGPLSSFTSLASGSTIIDPAQLIVRKWSIAFAPMYYWSPGTFVAVYTAGYTPQNVPRRIQDALIAIAGIRYRQPDSDMVAEKIGDYSYQRAAATQAGKDAPSIPK